MYENTNFGVWVQQGEPNFFIHIKDTYSKGKIKIQ